MSEINEHWKRDNTFVKKLTLLGVGVTPVLWFVSYQMAWPAMQASGPWQWFSAVSVATLLGSIAGTIATLIGIGAVVTDVPPLEGSNR